MGDFLSSAAFRPGTSSLRRPPVQIERQQTEAVNSTAEQPRGDLSGHGIQEIQPQTTAAEPTVPPSQQEQMWQARLSAFSNRQQQVEEVDTSGIKHTVAEVPPPKQPSQEILSTLPSASSSNSSSRARTAATRAVEDDDTLAAKRFEQLEERQAQPQRISSSIDAYNSRQDQRAIAAAMTGRNINNNEVLAHNERMQLFRPLGQQFARKAIDFTKTAMHFAEEGSALEQPALHALARNYDDLATAADRSVADFKKRLSQETISDRDLNEVTGSYQDLAARAESLKENKNYAEKGIQFSKASQSGSSSVSEVESAAAAVPYERLANYCFRMVNHDQIMPEEPEHYDPMVDLASQALEARDFGINELATALEKNIQTHEAIARCSTRMEQSSEPAVKNILSQALMAHRTARGSRNQFVDAKSSELENTKRLAAAASDEEFERAELMNQQNEEYKNAVEEDLQATSGRSSRSASPTQLLFNADGYNQLAQSLERTASCQEAIRALPDISSTIKSQKTFKERAQAFLAEAQKLHATALEQLQRNEASAGEDSLRNAKIKLEQVGKAIEAASAAAAKATGAAV